MLEQTVTDFIKVLSSKEPVPGGGGASAAVGAFAAALGMMVGNLTIGKKRYAEVELEVMEINEELHRLQQRLVQLAEEDAKAFEPLAKAYGLPKETEAEQREKERIMEECLHTASLPPLNMMESILQVMQFLRILGEKGSRIAISDVGVGILFAKAALEGASLNVFINTKVMKNREKAEIMNEKANAMVQEGKALEAEIYEKVLEQII